LCNSKPLLGFPHSLVLEVLGVDSHDDFFRAATFDARHRRRRYTEGFRRIFEKKGYSVAIAQTGKEAKEKLVGRDYDVTLVDLTLPDMNGADLLPGLKKKIALND